MPNQDYPGKARELAKRGRYGDSMLMHVNPLEVAMLAKTGRITINPDTGMPEAFFFLLPMLASLGSAALGGITAAAGAIGSGLAAGASALGSGLGAIGSGISSGASALGSGIGSLFGAGGGGGGGAAAAGGGGAVAGEVGVGSVLAPTTTAAETLLSAPALAPGLASAPTALAPGAGVLAPEFGGLATAAPGGIPDTLLSGLEQVATPIGPDSLASTGTNLGEFGFGSNTGVTSTTPSSGLGEGIKAKFESIINAEPAGSTTSGSELGAIEYSAPPGSPGVPVESTPVSPFGPELPPSESLLPELGNTEKLLLTYGGATLLEELLRDEEGNVYQGTPYGGEFVNSGREINPEAFASGGGSGERDYYFNKGGLVGSRRSANRDFYGAYDPYRGRRIR